MSEKKELTMPNEKITIEIEGDPIEIELPTVGGFIDIERRKIQLSGGLLNEMLHTYTKASASAYGSIEMIATMEVLIPNWKERLTIKSFTELKPHKIAALQKIYNSKVFPWLEEWRNFINAPTEEEEKKDAVPNN